MVILISMIYAASDEFHQTFIPGRDAGVMDFLTDSAGILLSVLIYSYMAKNINKKNKMKKETRSFKREKVTPNTVMFLEVPPPENAPIIGRIYLQSWFAGAANEIKVTVEPVN